MSVTHKSPEQSSRDELLQCPFCSAALPPSAAFCGHCGARIPQPGHEITSPLSAEIAEQYRVTSLARKTPYTQQYIAVDVQQRGTIVINDIDISSLDQCQRTQVTEAVSEEYELLRQQTIPHLMLPTSFRSSDDHLYIIAQQPAQPQAKTKQGTQQRYAHRLLTLHDLLQTGIGLPKKQVAVGWVYRLSLALEALHKREIIIGDIDPQMINIDNPDYSASPFFMTSWLPDSLRELFPQQSTDINTIPFYAPETFQGDVEPRSDIYSLGALLYLLLTGITPDSAEVRRQHPLPTPREFNAQIGSDLDSAVMQALSLDTSERFQSASEFSEALVLLMVDPDAHSATTNKPRQTHHLDAIKPAPLEINVTSQQADNKKSDDEGDIQPPVESEEVTVSIVPLQARMARRYLSKIKTSKLDLETKRATDARLKELAAEKKYRREAEVEEGLAKRKQPRRSKDTDQLQELASPTTADVADTPTVTITHEQVQAAASPQTEGEPAARSKATSTKTAAPDVAEIPTQLVQLDSVSRQPITKQPDEERPASDKEQTDQPAQAILVDAPASDAPSQEEQETPGPAPQTENTPPVLTDRQKATAASSTAAASVATTTSPETTQEAVPSSIVADTDHAAETPASASATQTKSESTDVAQPAQSTDVSEASNTAANNNNASFSGLKNRITRSLAPRSTQTRALEVSSAQKPAGISDKQTSFFQRLQHFILGEPQYTTTAAALIETPMRVQPNQNYAIRINIIGRNMVKSAQAGGLSGLHEGEKVHIEVRSAIYQNYAYIVQQADITIPASGFIAEVTMPMQPLTSGPSGRRERLHIFFMDEERTALYEKPFVIEIFVSHLVQNGHEGHNVLSIPI